MNKVNNIRKVLIGQGGDHTTGCLVVTHTTNWLQ